MAEISNERHEELRRVLEKQNSRTYTFEGAKDICDGLHDFYNILLESDIENKKRC